MKPKSKSEHRRLQVQKGMPRKPWCLWCFTTLIKGEEVATFFCSKQCNDTFNKFFVEK
jgi:hypothetical protein